MGDATFPDGQAPDVLPRTTDAPPVEAVGFAGEVWGVTGDRVVGVATAPAPVPRPPGRALPVPPAGSSRRPDTDGHPKGLREAERPLPDRRVQHGVGWLSRPQRRLSPSVFSCLRSIPLNRSRKLSARGESTVQPGGGSTG